MRCKYCKEIIFWDKTGCYPTWRHVLSNRAHCAITYAIPLEETPSPSLPLQHICQTDIIGSRTCDTCNAVLIEKKVE